MHTIPPSLNLEKKLIILDRDGVINYDSDDYIKTPDEWIPIPGSLKAIAQIKQAGFRVAIASNQSGIGRGYYTEETLAAIHQKMQNALMQLGSQIDFIQYCPHLPSKHCLCRKPQPGLLLNIAEYFQCEITGVPFIGDSLSDMEAAIAVRAFPIFIGENESSSFPSFSHLMNAIEQILAWRS